MAIKGKGKTKSRPVARAPRRMPVEVLPPIFLRRWVQVLAAFLAGALAIVLVVWATNGLRNEHRSSDRQAAAARQRTVVQAWQSVVESSIGKVGSVVPGSTPKVFSSLATALDSLQKGAAPKGTASTLKQSEAQAAAAINPLQSYDLVSAIRNKGFDVQATNYLLNSKTKIVEALQLYQQAAALGRSASTQHGAAEIKALGEQAAALQKTAEQILSDGWSDYQQALFPVGLEQAPQPPAGSGLPAGS